MDTPQNYLAVIKVIGIGGGGVNAVNRMIEAGLRGVEFIAVNTDAQTLLMSDAEVKLDIGRETTRGLGAGSDPEVGQRASTEHGDEIEEILKGADMVFITAGEENHVRTFEDLFDLVPMFCRRSLADFRVRSCAEAARGLAADVELHLCVRHQERLGIGIDGDELDAPEACLDHPVHRVHAAAADPDHLDHGEVVLGSIHRSSSPPGDPSVTAC